MTTTSTFNAAVPHPRQVPRPPLPRIIARQRGRAYDGMRGDRQVLLAHSSRQTSAQIRHDRGDRARCCSSAAAFGRSVQRCRAADPRGCRAPSRSFLPEPAARHAEARWPVRCRRAPTADHLAEKTLGRSIAGGWRRPPTPSRDDRAAAPRLERMRHRRAIDGRGCHRQIVALILTPQA